MNTGVHQPQLQLRRPEVLPHHLPTVGWRIVPDDPLLALDAALPYVAPLPLGDGQGEVQQELPGGGGRVELPL